MVASEALSRSVRYWPPTAQPFEPVYYFFYGTLREPDIPGDVLGLESDPTTRPATIYGYELANWQPDARDLIRGPAMTSNEGRQTEWLAGSLDAKVEPPAKVSAKCLCRSAAEG